MKNLNKPKETQIVTNLSRRCLLALAVPYFSALSLPNSNAASELRNDLNGTVMKDFSRYYLISGWVLSEDDMKLFNTMDSLDAHRLQ